MRRRLRLCAGLAVCVAAGWVVAASAADSLPSFERVLTLPTPRPVADIAMTDHIGAPRRLRDFAGRPVLLFFGFTHCPDVCPMTIQRLALLQSSRAKDLARTRIVLVSVDGERDTPAAMKDFLARFSPEFVGLTAPAAQVRELAAGFSAQFFRDPPRDGQYGVQHSTRVYALDTQGRLRAEMYDASNDAIVGLVQALANE